MQPHSNIQKARELFHNLQYLIVFFWFVIATFFCFLSFFLEFDRVGTFAAEFDSGSGKLEADSEKPWTIMCARHFAEEVKEILKEADVALQSIINEDDGKLVS